MPRARILAVDDQRYFRELIEGLLSEEGYAVQTASSGEEALHVLEREDFDVILTDLVMPGIDGTQLVSRIKDARPEQEIVMVTGVVDVKSAVEAMKQGATDYILKPFDRRALTRSLDQILKRRQLRDEHARLMAENLEFMGILSLYERAAGLFSTLNLEPLAERLIEGLCLETRAQGGVLWVVEDVGETRMRLVGVRGIVRLEHEPEEIDGSALGPAFALLHDPGRSVVLPWEPHAETGGEQGERADGGGRGAALYVPLRHARGLLGVARLTDKLEGEDFDDRDLAAANKFVDFGATAVANALRYRSLERRSFRDPTTKAYTLSYFQDVVRNEIQKASRFGRRFSLVRVDAGTLGEIRRHASESQLARWLEGLADTIAGALRATDLLASHSESQYAVLLPETDSLGAAVLVQRIRESVEESGILDEIEGTTRPFLAYASASYPSDGTQVDGLDMVLDGRLLELRGSLVTSLGLPGRPFPSALDELVEQGGPEPEEMPEQIARFVLDEISRRPREHGLLVASPGSRLRAVVRAGLEQMQEADCRTEVVLISERDETFGGEGVTRVTPERAGTDRPFLLFYGEGPAYAMLTAHKSGESGVPFFHTSDRALVEHLVFQLQRDLGIPLGD